jgi:chromosome segregation ATPase
MTDNDKKGMDITSQEIVMRTLISVQTALQSIDKQIEQMTNITREMAGRITFMSESMKTLNETKSNMEKISSQVNNNLESIEKEFGSHDKQTRHDLNFINEYNLKELTEIRNIINKMQQDIIEIKTKNNLIMLQNKEMKQEPKSSFFSKLIQFLSVIKNANIIVIGLIFLFMIVISAVYGSDVAKGLIELIKPFIPKF